VGNGGRYNTMIGVTHEQLSALLSAASAVSALSLSFTSWFTVGFGGGGIYVKWWAKIILCFAIACVVAAVVLVFA
jgi:hypothetical protein